MLWALAGQWEARGVATRSDRFFSGDCCCFRAANRIYCELVLGEDAVGVSSAFPITLDWGITSNDVAARSGWRS